VREQQFVIRYDSRRHYPGRHDSRRGRHDSRAARPGRRAFHNTGSHNPRRDDAGSHLSIPVSVEMKYLKSIKSKMES
jgi:hypothetical protein